MGGGGNEQSGSYPPGCLQRHDLGTAGSNIALMRCNSLYCNVLRLPYSRGTCLDPAGSHPYNLPALMGDC
jgi:hypothetical protein